MSDGIAKTGVFATPEEVAEVKQLGVEARNAPVARVLGRWMHVEAIRVFHSRIDELAVAHGLPSPRKVPGVPEPDPSDEIPKGDDVDHYGMLLTGEFTRRA